MSTVLVPETEVANVIVKVVLTSSQSEDDAPPN